jgi:radical SAM superfamily enzyme YgiQ (UPF0313 family)
MRMKVLLISGNRENTGIRVPALGLACIAAAVEQAGHKVQLLDMMIQTDPKRSVQQAIDAFRPNAIGISVRNIDDQNMRNPRFLLDQARDTAAWCRASCLAPLILGGAGFSILPDGILDYIGADMGIQGEGEEVFVKLLEQLQQGICPTGLPGLHQKSSSMAARRTFIKNLDDFPLPDPSSLVPSLYGAMDAPVPVQTRRGCPLSCSYCSTPEIEGKPVRWRSPESVVAWLMAWVDLGFRNFYFVDNTFNLPPSYAMHLCSKIIAAGMDIYWRCILFPGKTSPELIRLMADAGCREVAFGFESGSSAILQSMHKQYSVRDIQDTSELLRIHGIRRMGFLLLGGPGETRKTVEQSLALADSLDPETLKVTVGIRIYPRTDLAGAAMKEGLITSEKDLLHPRFYMASGLEDWLFDTLSRHMDQRPNWSY